MGLPPSMPIGVNSPTIEHISREIVHRLPPESPPLEKVPPLRKKSMLKCLAMLAMCLACGCDYCPRFTPLKPGTEVFLSHQGVTTVQGDSIGYGGHYDVHYGTKFRVLKDN